MGRQKRKKSGQEHSSFLTHRNFLFLKIALFVSVISLVGYIWTDFEPTRNGGTWYGYTLGTIGAVLIVWLTLLGLRKRIFSQGNWSLKAWTSAHVYLGLSLIVVATLHTGFQFGWNVHTLAYVLMMIVILSGLFGIYFYVRLPRQMSANRVEMSQAQMLEEVANLDRRLITTAQPLQDQYIETVMKSVDSTKLGGTIFKRISGKDRRCSTSAALIYFRREMRESDEHMRVPILDLISVLERKNALLERIRKHIRFKALLQTWLYIHIPMTFALLAGLTAHIVSVFYYN